MKGLQVNADWKPRKGYKPTPREKELQMALSGNMIWCSPTMEIVEKPIPEPKDDEVLMKVGGVGVCGSDTMFLDQDEEGYTYYPAHCKFPCIIGHEFSGEVAAVGKNVTTLKVGDLITAETMNWCGECMACRTGMFNQCMNLEEIGFTLDGGFAEYLVAKEKFCFNINGFLDIYGSKKKALEVGALIEPVAVAYNGLITRGGGFEPGSYVAIFGCGPIGLSAIAIAKAAGAAKVIVFDIDNARLNLAKEMGAHCTYNPNELKQDGISPAEMIMKETNGEGAKMLVEATHSKEKTLPEMENAIGIGAKIIQIGVSAGIAPLTSFKLQMKGASYHCTIGSAGHGIWQNVIKLVSSGVDISKMIYRTYGLDDSIEAITAAKKGAVGKIVVTPNLF